MKQCHKCKIIKEINNFSRASNRKDGYDDWCKDCHKEYNIYYNNKEKIKINNKVCIKCNLNKNINEFNKDKTKKDGYGGTCKSCVKIYDAKYNIINRQKRIDYAIIYTKEHKEEVRKKQNKRERIRRKEEPWWALKKDASREVNKKLKNIGKSKDGESSSKYFPWTDQEFFAHIELLFSHPDNLTIDGKVWMTWQNRGKYDPKTWNDNDSSTWIWQLDHINPHSTFYYETMDCQEFRDCWALSNLRPLSAKQNNIDTTRRTENILIILQKINIFLQKAHIDKSNKGG